VGQREVAFCSWALLSSEVFIVEDTLKDERFKDNPYVIGKPFIRFYAGFSIKDSKTGLPVGVFCIKDTKPRKLTVEEMGILFELAQKAEVLINS
jgi:GAF domain-containing protein